MSVAVEVENIGKRYRIRHERANHASYRTLRDSLMDAMRMPLRYWTREVESEKKEDFWALADVNFRIRHGEVVGIIGRNGAGKSTLLKILSRITKPTTGEVTLHGRVGSLLEVGTGFHPELNGRENIYLNGSILGMTRKEIQKQFDAIVDFSGVEKFLDTPVKRYSSGMYVRLAFAVAAHLNPEILIVDEVLAVGDAEFQKKCLGKMRDVATGGRTVIFVSHNMAAVRNLCQHAFLLAAGKLVMAGPVEPVLSHYQTAFVEPAVRQDLRDRRDRSGNGSIRITGFRIEDDSGAEVDRVYSGGSVVFVLRYECNERLRRAKLNAGLSLGTSDDRLLSVFYSSYQGVMFEDVPLEGEIRCRVSELAVAAGTYRVGARLVVNGVEADWPRDGIGDLVVELGDFYGTGSSGHGPAAPMLIRADWRVDPFSARVSS